MIVIEFVPREPDFYRATLFLVTRVKLTLIAFKAANHGHRIQFACRAACPYPVALLAPISTTGY